MYLQAGQIKRRFYKLQEWEMTPKQYYKKWINDIYADCDLTKKEIMKCYPFDAIFYNEYLPMLYNATREGIRIPDKILDKLTPEQRYRFLHDFPDMYRNYLPPEVRRQRREIYIR
jgi:hypothetical protein